MRAQRPNVIYAFWHGHLLYLMYRYRGSGVYILVSQSQDGELLSRILHRFGLPTIRGSSSRGGRRSLLELVRQTRAWCQCRHRSRRATWTSSSGAIGDYRPGPPGGVPIIPVAVGARWKIEFRSWDRFLLPLPGSRVVVAYGEPVVVPSDADAVVGAETPGTGRQTPQAHRRSNAGDVLAAWPLRLGEGRGKGTMYSSITGLFLFASIGGLPYFALKSLRTTKYRAGLRQRFGHVPPEIANGLAGQASAVAACRVRRRSDCGSAAGACAATLVSAPA